MRGKTKPSLYVYRIRLVREDGLTLGVYLAYTREKTMEQVEEFVLTNLCPLVTYYEVITVQISDEDVRNHYETNPHEMIWNADLTASYACELFGKVIDPK